jgi:UDP-N-acetylmuramate: L-alanyl-gamma-D-glutamyl-meso-diaminopimelate ligase
LDLNPDAVVVGNVMSRGMPVIEALLDRRIPYYSGPQWLYENVLRQRQVIAVSGTHGKTTTTSLLAWLLRQAGVDCGYLIGGVSQGLERSADLGSSPWFVIEADEYDRAFFDKRSKFLHYSPQILLINNLEFDHADKHARHCP